MRWASCQLFCLHSENGEEEWKQQLEVNEGFSKSQSLDLSCWTKWKCFIECDFFATRGSWSKSLSALGIRGGCRGWLISYTRSHRRTKDEEPEFAPTVDKDFSNRAIMEWKLKSAWMAFPAVLIDLILLDRGLKDSRKLSRSGEW